MASGTRSKRKKRRVENKEDIKHLQEEVWDFLPDQTFYKIFCRDASKGIQDVLNLTKDELKTLTWRDDNGDVIKLTPSEVGKSRSLEKTTMPIEKLIAIGLRIQETSDTMTLQLTIGKTLFAILLAHECQQQLETQLLILNLDSQDHQEVLCTN